jgi:thiol-disulfide isomerase/thioredoxin
MSKLLPLLSLFLAAGPVAAAEPTAALAALQPNQCKQATVVVFLGTGCPVTNAYLPHLNDLAKKYAAGGVAFVGINSNSQDSAADIDKHKKEFKIAFPVLRDDGQKLADALHAERVPEAVLLDAKNVVRYQGRIDDRYSVGGRKDSPRREDLAIAIDELLAGKEISEPRTKVSGCLIGRDSAKAAPSVTFSNQVARIVQKNCETCHRAEGVAPFALSNFEQVKGWASTIKEVVIERRMPPWHADPKHGKFSNARSLAQDEIDALVAWADGGRAKGDDKDLPKPIEYPKGSWTIGTPDVILAMAKEFDVPAKGVVPYQDFIVETNFKEDRWVERAQILPGSRTVHHAAVFLDGGDGHGAWLFLYVPGDSPLILPPGTAKRIPAGAKLRFNVHYTPLGKADKDRTSLGLIFAKAPPKFEVRPLQMNNKDIEVPPGAADHAEQWDTTISHDVRAISFFPHMHLRGKSWEAQLIYPDGRSEIMLSVPRYDFNWQHTYRFAEPLTLPRGTKLHCVAHYDNSERNPANPDPKKTVKFGPQSWDEMMVSQLEFIVPVGTPGGGAVASGGERGLIKGFAKLAAAEAAKLTEASLKAEPETDKAAVARIGEHAALVIPDKKLTESTLGGVGAETTIIGQFWLAKLAPTVDGRALPADKFQAVSVPVNQDRCVDLQFCVLGARKRGDSLQLVVFAKDKELLVVPLKKVEGKQGLPVEMDLKQTKGREGLLTFRLLGQYEVSLPVIGLGP